MAYNYNRTTIPLMYIQLSDGDEIATSKGNLQTTCQFYNTPKSVRTR